MMFSGREDQAQELYVKYRGQKVGNELWETIVLADFNKYRQAGRSHPLMDKIERLFDSKNWLQPADSTPAQHRISEARGLDPSRRRYSSGRLPGRRRQI